ncbi:STAS domain-containing protein [Streptomyces echinatus]|uniref:STAS domain-containing protein n=1 Tax=Streptomyces echinatus TaxID=67293 RepID=UPI003CD07456
MSENDTACVAEHRTVKGAALPHHATGGAIIVSVHGEMDAVTAPTLIERFDALTAHPHPDLVLDLRSVTFIDCAGLGVLCRARQPGTGPVRQAAADHAERALPACTAGHGTGPRLRGARTTPAARARSPRLRSAPLRDPDSPPPRPRSATDGGVTLGRSGHGSADVRSGLAPDDHGVGGAGRP